MIRGDQPMDRLTSILDLKENPHTDNTWADSTFTCTYHLDEGALKISVKETTDQATALSYFDDMQALAKDAKPIEGLANLGFPAYETADGSAVFQNDSFVLHVDATDLPPTLGPESITRNALAYQLSTHPRLLDQTPLIEVPGELVPVLPGRIAESVVPIRWITHL